MWEYWDLPMLHRLAKQIPNLAPVKSVQWRTSTAEMDLRKGRALLCYGPSQVGPVLLIAIRQMLVLFQGLGKDGQQYLITKKPGPCGKNHFPKLHFELLVVPAPIDCFYK